MLAWRRQLHGSPREDYCQVCGNAIDGALSGRLIFWAEALEPVFARPICGFDGPTKRAKE
jgi:hypothetical protein